MGRVFSNGLLKDFVVKPFVQLASEATQILAAAPFVTRVDELVQAARRGCSVQLIVGLNAVTKPEALYAVQKEPGIQVRYYAHRRFHAKIYFFGEVAMVGSSNLTQGGLQENREATIILNQSEDPDAFAELRAVFEELWDYAPLLTDDVLRRFAREYETYKGSMSVDDVIIGKVGTVEPPSINVATQKKKKGRLFLESLRRQVAEYRNAYNEVTTILEQNNLHRAELVSIGAAHQTNRFLSWVRRTHAPEESWLAAPIRTQDGRRDEILRLGHEWVIPENDNQHEEYLQFLENVQAVFADPDTIEAATKEELTRGLTSIHAFSERFRFVKKGTALADVFWEENQRETTKVKKTLKYLIYGSGDFVERLDDVLHDSSVKLRLFGPACALELFGTLKPAEYPPVNGRIVKGLRYLGFDVRAI